VNFVPFVVNFFFRFSSFVSFVVNLSFLRTLRSLRQNSDPNLFTL